MGKESNKGKLTKCGGITLIHLCIKFSKVELSEIRY